ncbi:MAG TPA: disulfide bond formation protein B [Noviherbaspirillum sp.]|nr:disulfide bond formation protein B [Noviherbaspirillum sp.]
MKTSKPVLLAVGVIALSLVGFALYLQHVKNMLPCPLCVIQRYIFVGLALVCFIFAALPNAAARLGAALAALTALSGVGVASWHLWIKAHPSVSCGIDPLETSLNKIPTAELLPYVFKADGLCTTEYAPILGLQTPSWSFIWFTIFALILIWAALRRSR